MSADIRLLQFSDPHLFDSVAGALRGVGSYESLRAVLTHAGPLLAATDAVLLSGDLVNDEVGGYRHVHQLFGALGKPVLCVPGNHDDPEALRESLSEPPFQTDGHLDLGAWRIILVDSCWPGQVLGRVSAGALERLEDSLRSAGGRPSLICLHHHPVPLGSRWIDSIGLQNADEFFAVTDRYPALRAIVWGHVHQSFDSRRKGVRLLATPSTCAQFLPHTDSFAIDPSPPGYRRLTLAADGTLSTEVLRLAPASHGHGEPPLVAGHGGR
jgi:3',5'-cyclic-AMP phosphodiesterase